MKKISYLLLAFLAVISLAGCGKKQNSTNQDSSSNTQTIEEITPKNEAKYGSKYFSPSAFNNIVSQFSYNEELAKNVSSFFENINGRIVDAYIHGEEIYFLTSDHLYLTHRLLMYNEVLNIDIKNNTKIEMIGNNLIVLSNDNNDYTIYMDSSYHGDYTECTPKDFNLKDNEQIVISSSDTIWDSLHIIKDITKNSITATTYSILNIYEENEHFGIDAEGKYEFAKKLEAMPLEYIVQNDKSTTRGFILLDNNTVIHVDPHIETIWAQKNINVHECIIEKVEKMFRSNSDRKIFIEKTGEKDSLFLYIYPYNFSDTEAATEIIYELPGFSIDDIESFISYPSSSEPGYLKLKDGRYFSYNENEEITEESNLTQALQDKNIVDYVEMEGLHCFIMDDGNIYTYLNDNMIERYNLK